MISVAGVGPIATALIGALGAVIGGLLTSGTQVLIERGRSVRQREAEGDLRQIEWRQAARLILEELRSADTFVRQAVGARRYWEPPRHLAAVSWSKYSPHLAAYLGDDLADQALWRRVAEAFNQLERLNWLADDRWRLAARFAAEHHDSDIKLLGAPRPIRARIWPNDATREAWRAIRAAIRELEENLGLEHPNLHRESTDAEIDKELWPHGDASEFDGEPDIDWFDRVDERG